MSSKDYMDALKRGKKQYNANVSNGEFAYLPVLETIINEDDIDCEVNLGIDQIPLRLVVGTCNKARTNAFASNFMPLLDWGTEFAAKWSNLSDSQINEGIRDPIKVYEYMNKFYVLEGNKRVSVLKFFNAVTVNAEVIRKIPKKKDTQEIKVYYEFMDFYKSTKLNDIYFSNVGSFPSLMNLVGIKEGEEMPEDDRRDFVSCFLAFKNAYEAKGGKRFDYPTGDAFLRFIHIFGYQCVKKMSISDMSKNVNKAWDEFELLEDDSEIDLKMNPNDTEIKKTFLDYILPRSQNKKVKIGFIFEKTPHDSEWAYAHELGRRYLEEAMPDQIETISMVNIKSGIDDEKALKKMIKLGANIIFVTSSTMVLASVKVAIANPNVKILNCSLNISHKYVRTYNARMYEAKFLTGLLAGALSTENKIGYVARYPVYGAIANINAFALGVKFVNPRAKVYVEWSSINGINVEEEFKKRDIRYISDQDMITPQCNCRKFGLYNNEGVGNRQHIAMPVLNWGVYYEKITKSILNGSWKLDENTRGTKALNYWWGMSAGVVDLICSNKIPVETRRLVETFKCMISKGQFEPFADELYDQNRKLRNEKGKVLSPEGVIIMDWLLDNVVGRIPEIDELDDNAKKMVMSQGISQE